MLTGWLCGFIYYILFGIMPLSSIMVLEDPAIILFFSGLFTFIGWFVVCIPFVIIVSENSRLLQVKVLPFFAAVVAGIAFLVLVESWLRSWQEGFWVGFHFLSWAMVIGLVAGYRYAKYLKRQEQNGDNERSSKVSRPTTDLKTQ